MLLIKRLPPEIRFVSDPSLLILTHVIMDTGKLFAVQVNMAWFGAATETFTGGTVMTGGAVENVCILNLITVPTYFDF